MNQMKKIQVNKATLISLKAELLRKQDEVNNAKLDPKNNINNFVPAPSSKFSDKDEGDVKKINAGPKLRDAEEAEALRKSKESLMKKAQLYDNLTQGSIRSEKEDHYLVDFRKKSNRRNSNDEDDSDNEATKNPTKYPDPDEDWVDYVDCLGRTRRCHKSDLDHVKERDEDLKKTLNPSSSSASDNPQWVKEGSVTESSEPVDPFKEKLFQEWDKKEQELMNKDTVHYEDLLFNEARTHGVGYYALSGDEAKRAKQQKDLQKLHDETEKARAEAAEKKARREEALQKRVKAARARQRARAGLPPDEETEPENTVTSMLLDFVEEQKKVSSEKARLEREAKEKEAQKLREKFVREWDMGKEGIDKHRVLTQDEWVDKKRKERPKDFAPPQTSRDRSPTSSTSFDKRGFYLDTAGSHKTWEDVRPQKEEPLPDDLAPEASKKLYFTTKRNKSEYYDPSVNTGEGFTPVPIQDELDARVDKVEEERTRQEKRKGAEFAPPPTFEYYGPVNKKRRPVNKLDIEDAIDQGFERLDKDRTVKEAKKDRFEDFI